MWTSFQQHLSAPHVRCHLKALQSHALRLGDRVSVLQGGRLVLDEPIGWSDRDWVIDAVGGA